MADSPTVNDLIVAALKLANILGVGQIASAEDMNDSLAAANRMLAQWNRQRWLVYVLDTYSLTATGQTFYTVGPGGDFNTAARPNRIESCYFRQPTGSSPYFVDYPVTIIEAREDYNALGIKGLQSFPQYAFYESDYPLGKLYIWPIPPAIYTIFISVLHPLGSLDTLTQELALPPEYHDVFVFNLAVRLCVMYGREASSQLIALAKSALSVLRRANAQVPLNKMPSDVLRRGVYNPYSDTNR
jgi:hypothetical protein